MDASSKFKWGNKNTTPPPSEVHVIKDPKGKIPLGEMGAEPFVRWKHSELSQA